MVTLERVQEPEDEVVYEEKQIPLVITLLHLNSEWEPSWDTWPT
ncbi:hypothetical protein [Parendozoicomonas sp. Alg238-R29]|nr:hypothetical protein [Parendozoicomonas sp. Alg238-R29]